MNNKKKYNFEPYPSLGGIPNDTQLNNWGIPTDNRPSDISPNNWFGASPIPTPNAFAHVNVEQVASLFNSTLRFKMPSSVKLITINGSEIFISNDVFEPMNISLIMSIKGQLENGIFKRENNSVLDAAYMPPNGLTSESYYVGYTVPNNDMFAVNVMTQAATRLIAIFKDLGIDLTSDFVTATNRVPSTRLRDIFMSAYVICMQIIIMYNTKLADEKAERLRNIKPPVKDNTADDDNDYDVINADNLDDSNLDDIFAMSASDAIIESEHKSIFDGIEPDETGMFNIEFDKCSDPFTEIIDKACDYELNNKEVNKNE